jgi:thiamine-monophosphate kinase
MMNDVLENRLLSRWSELLSRAPEQLGRIHESDAELVPLGDGRLLALTIDTVAEEVRVGLYREPSSVGRTAAVAALSDLAAVGADPIGLLLSVSFPGGDVAATQSEVARGVAEACAEAGTYVLGGDTNDAEHLAVSCVGVGCVPAATPLRRVGAGPGEHVFSSGPMGAGAALAAAALLGLPADVYSEKDWRPPVRIAQGRALRGVASVCMDTSDGLMTTLDQLTRLNGLAIRVTRPLHELLEPRVAALRERLGLSAFPFLAGHHGEFELVFCVPDARLSALEGAAARIGWRPVQLGRTELGTGLFVGERPVDGAWLRNLYPLHRGDLSAYVAALCSVDL